jgi:hypothetical protein
MRRQLFSLAAALVTVAASAGCGLVGNQPAEPSQKSGRIVVGDKSLQTQSLKCTQTGWDLTIRANANPGRALALLQLGGDVPVVRTVSIENIDGLSGVSGGDAGKAEASLNGSSAYTITGTAAVSDPATPGQTTDKPFRIDAPC